MRSSLEWVPARVERIVDLTPTVREFHVRPEGGVMPVTPGSHLQVQVLVGGRVSTRSYSLTSAGDDGLYRIAVKLLEQGRGSSRAMWQLAEGDRLSVTAPRKRWHASDGRCACCTAPAARKSWLLWTSCGKRWAAGW
jgi:ferredoxin-NADP reductase